MHTCVQAYAMLPGRCRRSWTSVVLHTAYRTRILLITVSDGLICQKLLPITPKYVIRPVVFLFVPFYRATLCVKRGLCCRPVSVCASVRPSRWCIVSIRLNMSSNFFLHPIAPSF